MALVESLILTVTVLYIFYKWGTNTYGYWKNQGVPQDDPKFPLVGNSWKFLARKWNPADGIKFLYERFPNSKVSGFYTLKKPWLMIRDPEILKTIMIKDFDHFVDRNIFGAPEPEIIFIGRDLITSRGQDWRELRNTLSPAFTAAKIKTIFEHVNKCGRQLTDYIENDLRDAKTDEKITEIDFKMLLTKFSNDVIATAAFGVQVDSLKEKDNEFYKHGMKMIEFGFLSILKMTALMLFPTLLRIFKIRFTPRKTEDFFVNIILDSIKLREENKLLRHDIIHLMLEARKATKNANEEDPKKKLAELTDIDIASNIMIFFFAGLESVSTALCFMVYELAKNQEVQTKLRREIDDVLKETDGKITYDGLIIQMKYLDMVVSESLRKWPAMFSSDRQVSKPYKLQIDGSPEVELNTGDMIMIPIYAIHRDPQYFPDPEKFDPERFNEFNKSKIAPYTYMPFGAGPRSCIGNRFALMEIKMCLVHLVRKFIIMPSAATKMTEILDEKSAASLALVEGFQFKIKLRDDLQE